MIESPDLRFFAVLARAPSLAAAARSLNVSPPAVSQRLSLLEQRLGLRLLERGRGPLVLTADGEALLRRADGLLQDLALLHEDLQAQRQDISGPLRVIAPFGFGRLHIAPAIAQLIADHPGIAPDLVLSDDPFGASRQDNWDLIIHIGQLPNSSLTSKKLAPNRRYLLASPDYLDRNGRPQTPEDLKHHACGVIREDQADMTMWGFLGSDGQRHTTRITPAFSSNDGEVIKSWALAGLGIVQRSEWNVATELQEGRLQRVLTPYKMPDADIIALLNPRTLRTARVQHALDALTAYLTPAPWGQS